MSWLLAVDPGLHACGCAMFRDGVLERAGMVARPINTPVSDLAAWAGMSWAIWHWAAPADDGTELVMEIPQVYPRSKGDPNDLIQLAGVAGAIAAGRQYLSRRRNYYPREWKGQVPKPARRSERYIIEDRMRAALSAKELARVPMDTGPRWDVIDAIGIGLHYLGRLGPMTGERCGLTIDGD